MSHLPHDAILLVNLGSPDAPATTPVRQYLREFLSDPRVIDIPAPLRWLLVNLIIAPFRAPKSAHAYRSIWTPEGSPLVHLSRELQGALQSKVRPRVHLAMRYGEPSILSAMKAMAGQGVGRLLLVPLYPHYAMSSYETVVVEARQRLAECLPNTHMDVLPPFYGRPGYLDALADSARPHLAAPWDHLLFSFHGLPERHLHKSDPTGTHCLRTAVCCEKPSIAHATCYRHQVMVTAHETAQRLGIVKGRYSIAFQSRLGRAKWLDPNTAEVIPALAAQGVKRLAVICPSFVSDCLETLEEIGIRARESFQQAGGEELRLVPCLNTDPRWVGTLAGWCENLGRV